MSTSVRVIIDEIMFGQARCPTSVDVRMQDTILILYYAGADIVSPSDTSISRM